MSDLEQYAKEHQVPIMMDGGLKFLLEKLQENQCLSFLELGTAIARTSIEVAKFRQKRILRKVDYLTKSH